MIEQWQENRGITWRPYKEHRWTCKRERQASYFTIIDAAGANPLHQHFNSTMLQGLLGLGTDALITTKMMGTNNSTRNMLQKHAQEQQGLQQLCLYNMPCSPCGRFHCQNTSPPFQQTHPIYTLLTKTVNCQQSHQYTAAAWNPQTMQASLYSVLRYPIFPTISEIRPYVTHWP